MAAVLASNKFANTCRVAKTARRVAVKVQASQKLSQVVQKVALAATTLPALIASSPAFALVDDRLNGDGAGLPLGINEPILGWAMAGVFLTVWIAWFNGQKDLGDFEDDESGLSL